MPVRTLKILALAFCPLLLALCLLPLPACKKPTEPKAVLPDTTNHNFVFAIDTLGDGSSSVLNDVWIFDENNIWAVGEVYLNDATGQIDPVAYNVAHWDGKKWNLMQLYYPFNQTQLLIVPIRGIYAFGPNDIWLAAGSVFRWNGSFIQPFLLRPMILSGPETVEKLWGTSSSDLYGVGNSGTIVHYNGSNWQKLDSGTDLDIRDIWGSRNEKTGELEILAVASIPRLELPRRKLFKLTESTVETLADSGIAQETLAGIWFSPGNKYVVVGSGIYRKNHLEEPHWLGAPRELTEFYSSHVRGVAANDIVVVGAFGDALHFNGSTWKQYPELRIAGSLFKVAFSHQTVAAVGYVGNRAVVVIGRRY